MDTTIVWTDGRTDEREDSYIYPLQFVVGV